MDTILNPESLADQLRKLGNVSASRVRSYPYPGTATPADVERIHAREDRLFELVDGILVEKAVGFRESFLTTIIAEAILTFVRRRKLGIVTGPDCMLRLAPRLVRGPDLSYFAWDRIPGKKIPKDAIPKLVPNLAVEVLSKGNTVGEMKRKRREYFKAGVELVWIVNPRKRVVEVYISPKNLVVLRESDILDGGDVLPGFKLKLSDLFGEMDETCE